MRNKSTYANDEQFFFLTNNMGRGEEWEEKEKMQDGRINIDRRWLPHLTISPKVKMYNIHTYPGREKKREIHKKSVIEGQGEKCQNDKMG